MLLITNFRGRHPKRGKFVPRKSVPAKISSLLRYFVEYGWEVTLKRLKGFCWQPVFLQDDSEHRSFLHCRKIFSRIFEISRLYYRVNVSKRFRGFVSTWIKSGTSKYLCYVSFHPNTLLLVIKNVWFLRNCRWKET